MRVRATQVGFFGGVLRQPDTVTEEFVLTDPEAQFSADWMVKIDAPEPTPAPATPAAPAPKAVAPKADTEKL